MLKGYINCTDTKNLLLRYINFELRKKEMLQVAQHLRNCPKCMEEYSKIQTRKKNLKEKMKMIEKKLRMELEISTYIDNELGGKHKKQVENMIKSDENYRIELNELKRVLSILHKAEDLKTADLKFKNTKRIIAEIRAKNIRKIRFQNKLLRFFNFNAVRF